MKNIKLQTMIAVGFFLFWLTVLYAGADHPVPRGFIFVILLDIIAAVLVFWRVSGYLVWQREKKRFRKWLAMLDGVAIGLIFALITVLTSSGEPSVTPGFWDYVIWFVVVGMMGVINALGVYAVSWLLGKWVKPALTDH